MDQIEKDEKAQEDFPTPKEEAAMQSKHATTARRQATSNSKCWFKICVKCPALKGDDKYKDKEETGSAPGP
ncbi:hypothetical protein GX48_00076 [Paracoccidioides brasiliensis]|nr:hypothetical protein GX48_00076 [Paracoccidioides brasiliensis]